MTSQDFDLVRFLILEVFEMYKISDSKSVRHIRNYLDCITENWLFEDFWFEGVYYETC